MDKLEELCSSYAVFINQLGGGSLFLLSLATASSITLCIHFSNIPTVTEYIFYTIACFAFLDLVLLAAYIICKRNNVPNPPAPIQYPNLRCFFKSVSRVAVLAFFFFGGEPLKSVSNIYISGICISAYLHVLVVLAIFRRRDDYGVSDGCLAAAFGVLFPMAKIYPHKIYLILGTILLCGLRDLQLQPHPIPLQNLQNTDQFPPPPPPFATGGYEEAIAKAPPSPPPFATGGYEEAIAKAEGMC